VQVCVPKGFESLCFDIDVRFLGSMCAERVYGGGIHKNVKRKELRVEGRKRRAGKGEAPVPVLRFQSATNFRGPIRNPNCAHLTFPFPFLTYCGLSGGLKADLPGGPAITTEVRIPQMTSGCQGLIWVGIWGVGSKRPPFAGLRKGWGTRKPYSTRRVRHPPGTGGMKQQIPHCARDDTAAEASGFRSF